MAVSVNNVYKKVLALANKEQRGYITPQDFNLFANQAQLEIFEQYFYDLNIARKSQGNDTVVADVDTMIENKLNIFERFAGAAEIATFPSTVGGGKVLPENMYRVLSVGLSGGANNNDCEILNSRDYKNCKTSPLTKPTLARPIANLQGKIVKCNNGGSDTSPSEVTFLRTPNHGDNKVNWTYVVVNKRAMYNATGSTTNFELHESEEIQLVNKILKLSGLATEQEDVMKVGHAMENIVSQQQQKI